ncbi:MAG: protein translocase subunit SecF [Neisseriaceae bacterium]|nr:protein translocase subunit SecF [Neisseriaceae bacterium]
MELLRLKRDIQFMSYGKLTTTISLLTFFIAIFFLFSNGLNRSVEFTGGTIMEVRYASAPNLEDIRQRISSLNLGEVQVQNLGSAQDVMLRLPVKKDVSAARLSEEVLSLLRTNQERVDVRKVEFVGPSVGDELVTEGLMALLFVCLGIVGYLALRFEWRFAVAALVANLHDVVIILGCFAAFQWEFSLTVLAGILAVLGYSVNESVVVFDRIRENFRDPALRDMTIPQLIDNAITATMSRTIITHGSTEAMVLSMLIFGGPVLHGFAMALTIGIVFGVYSSVLVASPMALMLGVKREHMIKLITVKEEAVV